MALLWMDGFDQYAATADLGLAGVSFDATGAGNWTFQSAAGINGGGAIQCEQDDVDASIQVRETGGSDLRLRGYFLFKSGGTPSLDDFFFCIQDSARNVGLASKITSGGEISIYKSSTSLWSSISLMATSSGANLHDGNYHSIQIHFLETDSSSSVFQVWVDGTQVINYSGDTRQIASTGYGFDHVDRIEFRSPDTSGLWDDIVFWDDAAGDNFTGAITGSPVIRTLLPNAAGDSSTFTPSAGFNYQNVDESGMHDGDTTYNDGGNSDKDLYNIASLPATPTAVLGLAVVNIVKALGTDATMNAICKSSTTEGAGSSVAVTAGSYQKKTQMYGQDPNTAAAWSEAGVNAAQIGLTKTA